MGRRIFQDTEKEKNRQITILPPGTKHRADNRAVSYK